MEEEQQKDVEPVKIAPVKMTDAQAGQYLSMLMGGKLRVHESMEKQTLAMFKDATLKVQQLAMKIGKLEAELQSSRTALAEVKGQRNGFAMMLVMAEEARRTMVGATGEPHIEDPKTGNLIPLSAVKSEPAEEGGGHAEDTPDEE